MNATMVQLPSRLPKTFEGLVAMMAPHAIENEADYDAVAAVVDRLAVMGRRTRGQERYLETLSQLVEAYDAERYPIEVSGLSPLAVLKSFMRAHEMTPSDLGRLLGNRALGAKIVGGRRELSKAHIRALADHFKVSPGLFL